jgi:hypothetical protein
MIYVKSEVAKGVTFMQPGDTSHNLCYMKETHGHWVIFKFAQGDVAVKKIILNS